MSRSTHQIEVRGVDKTAGAFRSIKGRAQATGSQIKSLMGGALAAAGGYLAISSIKSGIDQLGHLSDIAQKTGTDVGELTRAANAFAALGIQNMGIDQVGKAFDYMKKTTGRSGMEGFYQTIAEIGKIPDAAKRGQEAMRIFGRSGMELMPLIEGANGSAEALRNVADAMPGVSQAAADAGDAVSDSMGMAANQVKSIWLEGLGAICSWFDDMFVGGIREAALTAGNYLEYYTKSACASCVKWIKEYYAAVTSIGTMIGSAIGGFMEDGFSGLWQGMKQGWSDGINELKADIEMLEDQEEDRIKRFSEKFNARQLAIAKFAESYNAAAKKSGSSGMADMPERSAAATVKSTAVRNDLLMAGSNAALRLSQRGPQYAETKKQTKLLEQIAANTKKSAEETPEEYGAI